MLTPQEVDEIESVYDDFMSRKVGPHPCLPARFGGVRKILMLVLLLLIPPDPRAWEGLR